MNLRATLQAQLRHWDDDTFAALANRGLLRRAGKDLASETPEVTAEDEGALALAFAGHRLRFDARGPAKATCSCPTAGVCQHILSVALWLKAQDAAEGAATATAAAGATNATCAAAGEAAGNAAGDAAGAAAVPPSHADPLAPLHDALLRFTAAELSKHAGKPGYRWAWQFVQDLDPERDLRLARGSNLVIGFLRPRVDFRYPGGGLDALVADAEVGAAAKYRVAAVLAYQRAHGVAIAAPESSAAPRPAALDLGQDHALPEVGEAARGASRARLRASIRKLIAECVELGLSHLSQAIADRFATLAVWSQGADYPRLARQLRRLADHVELLLARAGGADEHRLFEEATQVHALVAALESADAKGAEPGHLVGRARDRFDALGEVELLGLGALPWRAASGYVGLTLLFWAPAMRRFLSCTDARPEGQPGFDPVKRYRQAGPWQGLGAPELTSGRRLRLADAQASGLGKLSASEKTCAQPEPVAAADFLSALDVVSDWSALVQARAQARRSLLAEPEPMQDWVVLRPATCGAARFDATRQVLDWPLVDAAGARIDCELAYSPLTHPAIERLQAMTPENFTAGTHVVARLRDTGTGLVAEPLSLLQADRSVAVDALYFDAAPAAMPIMRGLLAKAVAKWRQARAGEPAPLPPPPPALPPALEALRVFLRRQAERGFGAAAVPALQAELQAHGQRLADAGLVGFAPDPALPPAEQLLRAHYLQLQLAHLLGADAADEDDFEPPPGAGS